MCFSAISFVRIKRNVYAALNDDGKEIVEIADGISIEPINSALVRGPIELVPGVRREEGKQLLAAVGKLAK
jgi:tRNA(adenine34) deaminase